MYRENVLILRTCDANLQSRDGFQWPSSGPVKCSDWNPQPHCGNGLHGFLWGEGNGALADWSDSARWMVVEVAASDIVKIDDDKVKFPKGNVVFVGSRKDATDYLIARSPPNKTVIGAMLTVGDKKCISVGYGGTATAGYNGTATAGDYGTATAGDYGTATAGYAGTATAGDYGTATAGYAGTATAGHSGTATAGHSGTATAGNYGTATAGDNGTVSAGANGILQLITYVNNRKKIITAYVGEKDIQPNVKYQLDKNNKFIRKRKK